MKSTTVRAGHGAAISVRRGDSIDIVNTHGTQVVDFWCVGAADANEHLSMSHCREVLSKIFFRPGDVLISNRYAPMLEILSDTSAIQHDTLIAACSDDMYRHFGLAADHRSCASNYRDAMKDLGRDAGQPPQPWNLFMCAAVDGAGTISYSRPPYVPGATVSMRLLCDATIIVSSCPDDHYPTNGGDGSPADFCVNVLSSREGLAKSP